MRDSWGPLWTDLPLNLTVLLSYLIFAKIGLFFAIASGNVTIFWPAGGFALAVLLLGGIRFLPGIFAGAFAAGVMTSDTTGLSVAIAIGNALESLAAFLILDRLLGFNRELATRQDFFKLTLLAGGLASIISTLIGTASLVIWDVVPGNMFGVISLRWWMADVLGIAFMTPTILIWCQPLKKFQCRMQALEITALFVLSFLAGQTIFFDWFKEFSYAPQGVSWIILLIIWSAMRAGRQVTVTLQLILFTQALWSAGHGMGHYANDMIQTGLVNFWIFGMVLAVGGMAVAVMSEENRKTQKEWQRLHKSISSSLNEIYLFNADTLRFFFVNEGARRNLGYSMEELESMTPLDLTPYHTQQTLQERLLPLIRHEKQTIVCESMHRRKDGSLYPIEVHLQLLEDGEERYYQAVILDTTERLEAEHNLRLAAQVFESSTDGIEICDANNLIVSVNRAFTQITGYSEEDVIGENPSMLSSGKQDTFFYQTMWSSINQKGHWNGEIWNRRKNGEIYPEWLNISTVKNTRGEVLNYIGMFSDITERKAAENFLQHQAQHDFLTNLPNRTLFHDRFQQLLARARRDHEKFALIYLDLDDFKPVNDTYGHRVGDLLLQEVAHRLTEVTRETDTISRQGGDEFTILIPGIETEDEVQTFAIKLITAIEKPCLIEGISLQVTASIGLAIYPDDGSDEVSLMSHADKAMYLAKNSQIQP